MSTQPQLPPIASLPTLPPDSLTTVLTTLFEPSPHLPPLILPIISSSPTPDSYTSLITSIRTRLHTLAASSTASDREVLDSVLSSHPRLGAPKDADISALSRGEQANLNSGEVGEELGRLNGEYEGRFGVRYVYVSLLLFFLIHFLLLDDKGLS